MTDGLILALARSEIPSVLAHLPTKCIPEMAKSRGAPHTTLRAFTPSTIIIIRPR